MPIFEVQANGKTFEVEAPSLRAAITAVRQMGPAVGDEQALPARGGLIGPDQRGAIDKGLDALAGYGPVPSVIAGATRDAIGGVSALGDLARTYIPGVAQLDNVVAPAQIRTQPLSPDEELGARVNRIAEVAGGVKGAANVVGAGARAIPTRARAGQKFQQVMAQVGDKPVDIAKPGDAALRISELAERGGSMPKAVRDFLRRATDPEKAEPTYREMRDFYSNISRLSADEAGRLTPVVRKQLGELRSALNEALAKTAASGGHEKVYRAAMREYAVASRLRELSEAAVKYGAGVAGVGAAYKFLND